MEKLNKVLENIADDYLNKPKHFGRDCKIFKYIKNDACQTLEELINENFRFYKKELDLKVKSSCGKGNWASVPWLGIFDDKITHSSAQKGVYIVYLFSIDMKRVYLTLELGWDQYEKRFSKSEANEKIKNAARYYRTKFTNNPENDVIDLISGVTPKPKDLDRPRGYEMGSILSKKYDVNNLPKNDQLIRDLQDMLQNYKELIDSDFDFENVLDLEPMVEDSNVDMESNHETRTKRAKRKAFKIDYSDKEEKNKTVGTNGENYVLNYERERLKNTGFEDKIKYVAENDDGAGYDILSFEKDGTERYIEVKTTKNPKKDREFFFSPNELEFSIKHDKQYVIYRVYNFNSDDPEEIKIDKYRGRIDKNFVYRPTDYITTDTIKIHKGK